MLRTCKRCSGEFELEYRRGRPREHCFSCQPLGTRQIGAATMYDSSPNTRLALAYLKSLAVGDAEAIRVLTAPDSLLELVEALADLLLLFIGDLSDNPAEHVDRMFTAFQMSEEGNK
jgi:hypothetical protein